MISQNDAMAPHGSCGNAKVLEPQHYSGNISGTQHEASSGNCSTRNLSPSLAMKCMVNNPSANSLQVTLSTVQATEMDIDGNGIIPQPVCQHALASPGMNDSSRTGANVDTDIAKQTPVVAVTVAQGETCSPIDLTMSDISVNVNSLDNQKEDPTRRVNINPNAVDVTEDLNNLATTVQQRNEMGNSAAMEHNTINDSESNNKKGKLPEQNRR